MAGGPHPTPPIFPRPGLSSFPSPLSFSQRPNASFRPAQRSPASRAPSSPLRSLTELAHASCHCQVGPSCWSRPLPRVRAGHEPEPQQSRTIRASSPFPARLLPFIYPPRCPATPISTRAPAAAQFPPILAAAIHAESNSPLCRVLATVSDLPTFSSLLRSRRGVSFVFFCFLRVHNLRRTSLQSRRPPFVVASPSRPLFVAVFALGEFAPSS